MTRNIVVLGIFLAVLVLGSGPVFGQALHIKGGRCGMAGADENGDFIPGGGGTVTLVLENANKVMLKCHGSDLTNLSGKAQHFTGLLCGTTVPSGGVAVTNDCHATIAKNGQGQLTATFDKPEPPE